MGLISMPKPIIDSEGNKRWYNEQGELHREDGPAVEYLNGTKEWYLNGKLHREDGPAFEWADGTKEWWLNGLLHREDGPAVEWKDGYKSWWLNDKRYTEEEFALLQFMKGINIYA